uniref:uncharacterized protein LOC143403091 isoform X2 n=1 Tax=Callospermophilus lateralis TaxID=76772 RepID=UPI00403878BC
MKSRPGECHLEALQPARSCPGSPACHPRIWVPDLEPPPRLPLVGPGRNKSGTCPTLEKLQVSLDTQTGTESTYWWTRCHDRAGLLSFQGHAIPVPSAEQPRLGSWLLAGHLHSVLAASSVFTPPEEQLSAHSGGWDEGESDRETEGRERKAGTEPGRRGSSFLIHFTESCSHRSPSLDQNLEQSLRSQARRQHLGG